MSWDSIVPIGIFAGLVVLWAALVLRGGAGG
jgi:hypothetical protein